MANTTVRQTRQPRTPKTQKPAPETVEPEVQAPETLASIPGIPGEAAQTVPTSEPETTAPATPELKPEPEPKVAPKPVAGTCTDIYLVQKGEKYHVYRGIKRLTRNLVTLEKARLIAAGYGENNPTIK